jgi:hypothetical protein
MLFDAHHATKTAVVAAEKKLKTKTCDKITGSKNN